MNKSYFRLSQGYEIENYAKENKETANGDDITKTRLELPKDLNHEYTNISGRVAEYYEAKSGQEIAEECHDITKKDMIRENGKYMSQDQIARLESHETKSNLHVVSEADYRKEFPKIPESVLGHCDPEGIIYIKDLSREGIEHVSTHETMHLCSHRNDYINEIDERVIETGLRHQRIAESGNGGHIEDSNRAINEGFTEMYTLKELRNQREMDGREVQDSLLAYRESQQWASRMEYLLGKDVVKDAYYGEGYENMVKEFNRLNGGNPNAWSEFSRDVDIVEYHRIYNRYDQVYVDEAKVRLNKQIARMYLNKNTK